MKIALGVMQFDLESDNVTFSFDIGSPGIARHTFIKYEEPKLLLARGGPPKTKAIPCVVVECDPDLPMRERQFVVVPVGKVADFPGTLEYFCCFTNPQNGAVIGIYEVLHVDAEEVADVVPATQ